MHVWKHLNFNCAGENNKTNNHGRVHVQNVIRDFPQLQHRQA